MTPLTQQLEDKKKEHELLSKGISRNNIEYIRRLNSEIAILEQAIAEMQKQRQEEIKFLKDESDREIKKIGKPSDWIIKRIIELEDKQQLNQPKEEQ